MTLYENSMEIFVSRYRLKMCIPTQCNKSPGLIAIQNVLQPSLQCLDPRLGQRPLIGNPDPLSISSALAMSVMHVRPVPGKWHTLWVCGRFKLYTPSHTWSTRQSRLPAVLVKTLTAGLYRLPGSFLSHRTGAGRTNARVPLFRAIGRSLDAFPSEWRATLP